ncbi:hypothetical protein V6615_16235 [Oscillospiraceae bacterium PP1C4]
MIGKISATEIDAWAKVNPRRSQEILPELMIRLILATSKKIRDFNFPIEKGIQFAGYDGVLESNENTNFFPEGNSVWEFGTDNNAVNKFRDDLKKRSSNSLGVNIKETTFIFSTLKIWNHQTSIEELINESKKNCEWKDIRIIDASKIALWLEHCPGVSIWMRESIGKYVSGVLSIEQYWNDYCFSTTPALTREYFLMGRDEPLETLSAWLRNESAHEYRVLMAESSLEATLFVVASIMSLSESDDNKLKCIKSKVLIITSFEAWDDVISYGDNYSDNVFIPIFNFTEDMRCPRNISAILPISKYSPNSKITKNITKIEIPLRTRDGFNKALELLGYTTGEAYEVGTKTKRSFLSFYRTITNIPSKKQPKWTALYNLRELIPALLLGGWNDKYLGDREIVAKISGISYEEYTKILSKWMSIEDAPIFSVLGSYQIVSIQDSWEFLFDMLAPSDVDGLINCMKDIFSTTDPALDLPEKQRFMASVYRKNHKYSTSLQHGVVISLIMLTERDSDMNSFGVSSTSDYVYASVRDILSTAKSSKQLCTIAPSLSLLAEASSRAVLEKLELEIKNENSELWQLFVPSEDFLTGRNYYTHILWALEMLVWYKSFAVRSIIVLAEICEKNFEYKMTNSPQNSLYEIFCIWYPQSCLSKDERLQLLRKICDTYPATGWTLLKSLLPKGNSICSPIQHPRWSTIEIEVSPSVTIVECNEVASEIIKLSLSMLSNNTEQWETIFNHIDLYENHFEELSKKCINCCESLDKGNINIIAGYLREQIYRFRKYKDSNWSISEEYVFKLERLFHAIEPKTIERYQHLFTWQPNLLNPIPYNKEEHSNFEKENALLFEARSNAVDAMIETYGVDALIDFSSTLENINDLGAILAEKLLDDSYDFVMLKRIKKSSYLLYASVLWILVAHNGLESLVDILKVEKSLSDDDKGDILCHTPLSSAVWGKLELFNQVAVDYYWEHVRAFRLDNENLDSTDHYLVKLLEYNRPFSAIQVIAYTDYNNTDIIIRILEKCLQMQEHKEASGISLASVHQHNVLNLFDQIYKNQNVDELAVARLEIAYIPYFRYDGNPRCLVRYLQKNPREYVLFITKCYKPDEPSEEAFSEEKQLQSHTAYDILDLFKSIPGCNESEQSADIFYAWVSEADEYARSLGYGKAFELCLGKLLSYSPVGSDGIFPHEIVRKYLEKNYGNSLVNDFIIGKINQRGVYAASGGLAEKEIADRYYNDSQSIKITYPKTSAILERLGDNYRRESQFEQKQELLDFRE